MPLTEFPAPAAIVLHVGGHSREEVLAELVRIATQGNHVPHPELLLEALTERERLGSTGIGHGVAVPHCRIADLAAPVIVVGRTDFAVDVDAIDGQPARLFFLLIAPEGAAAVQVQLLARIARLMRDDQVRRRLLEAETPAQALDIIMGKTG